MEREGSTMYSADWFWPSSNMDFWKIDNKETSVKIKWSHNCFEDYKTLAYQFYECGYKTFEEVIGSGQDNVKSDMWFLTGIFLVRHSIELGLKALLCRVLPRKRDIEDAFEECLDITTKKLILPNSVKYIGNNAFAGIRVEELELSTLDHVIEINVDLFDHKNGFVSYSGIKTI